MMSHRVGKVNFSNYNFESENSLSPFSSSIFLAYRLWNISTRLNVGTQIVHLQKHQDPSIKKLSLHLLATHPFSSV
jgi:hypothetical protein